MDQLVAAGRLLTLAVVLIAAARPVRGDEPTTAAIARDPELARDPSWAAPAPREVRRRVDDWLASERVAEDLPELRAAADAIWQRFDEAGRRGDLLDTVMEIVMVVDSRAELVGRLPDEDPAAVEAAWTWLDSPATAGLERDVVRLWLGRELARRERFDEALVALEPLDVASSIDPATLLFHRGCCQHWLLDREAALESFDRLLEREDELPARFARLARLLRADIAAVRSDSLDHIARRMRDVRRRLDLGQAGPETRRVQAGVIESLDKLIEDLEQQQQQQQGQAAAGGGSGGGQGGGAARPMDDSKLARGLGKGEVKKRDLGDGDGWGDLPPHEREAALQQIGREFPPHYREAIEEYFKRLATGGEEGP
jgi:tetratricopeptide (TPR) repeat protein